MTLMPPPSSLSKMVPCLRYWHLYDNSRLTETDLYNTKGDNTNAKILILQSLKSADSDIHII